MSITAKFKKSIDILRGAAEGQIALDHKYPKIYKKVTKFYIEKGVEFKDDPCDDYEILLDCLYADLVTEGVINEWSRSKVCRID